MPCATFSVAPKFESREVVKEILMRRNNKKRDIVGWLIFVIAAVILFILGIHGLSAKNQNIFVGILFLVSIFIVLLVLFFYRSDERNRY